mmetsp:Transcript_15403/g.26291  ORF Transcript_15403/g.26291 Transcript_15403/m.26291 type:complete len:83 (-) Transcript_15403:78-326(-)
MIKLISQWKHFVPQLKLKSMPLMKDQGVESSKGSRELPYPEQAQAKDEQPFTFQNWSRGKDSLFRMILLVFLSSLKYQQRLV